MIINSSHKFKVMKKLISKILCLSLVCIVCLWPTKSISETNDLEDISLSKENYCAVWRSNSTSACRHSVRVDNNCNSRVWFRITLSNGTFTDYYVNPGAWYIAPINYCGQYHFMWL